MGKKIQLTVKAPCHENWEAMKPEEMGRYCGSCCKTVVDFTAMSDEEMLAYWMKRKGETGICGHFNADQLDRSLGDVANRRRFWGIRIWMPWVLAAVLLTTRVHAQGRGVKAEKDSVKVLDTVYVRAYGTVMGKLTTQCVTTVRGEMSGSVTTTTWTRWKDSVRTALDFLRPDEGIRCYPNPVRRGAMVNIDWKVAPGAYRMTLMNAAGTLVETRAVQVGTNGQVDQWATPAGLAAGVYVLRAQGEGKVYTKEVVIL